MSWGALWKQAYHYDRQEHYWTLGGLEMPYWKSLCGKTVAYWDVRSRRRGETRCPECERLALGLDSKS